MKPSGRVTPAEIERALLDAPGLAQDAIAQRLGVTRHAVRQAQDALVARDVIRIVGTGKGAFRSKVKPPPRRRSSLERARAALPVDPTEEDGRRLLLALTLQGLAQWPTVQASVERGVPLLEAVWHAAEDAGPDSRHASALVAAGAFALPTELAAAMVYTCGYAVALEVLAAASRIVAADQDRPTDDQGDEDGASAAPATPTRPASRKASQGAPGAQGGAR